MHPNGMFAVALALPLLAEPAALAAATSSWGQYNRQLTGERWSELREIDTETVGRLGVLCSYDLGARTSFQSGLLQVQGHLIGTTESDTFAIDPDTCSEQWRSHETLSRRAPRVNRGAAYADHRIFRGLGDGRVAAYDSGDGHRLWEARLEATGVAPEVTAAPLTWNGLVYIGTAGGDTRAALGVMYALDGGDGRVLWHFALVPENAAEATRRDWRNAPGIPVSGGGTWSTTTLDPIEGLLYVPVGNAAPAFARSLRPGANRYTESVLVLDARRGDYAGDLSVRPGDFHDWDVSSAPVIVSLPNGRRLLAVGAKDGYLHVFDLTTRARLYDTAITRIENAEAPLGAAPVRFCPGAQGGIEWNGPAWDPQSGLIFTGATDWCTTVATQDAATLRATTDGADWTGAQGSGARALYGHPDPVAASAGWVYAIEAVSGRVRWRFRAARPIVAGVTPTAGGVVFAGDTAGTLYVLEAASGRLLWQRGLGGALGGGLITYDAGRGQRIAVAVGMSSPLWPAPASTGRVVVLGIAPPR